MKSFFFQLLPVLFCMTIALNSGCNILSQNNVTYYDLGSYQKQSSDRLKSYQVRIVNATAVASKMVYFRDNFQSVADDSARFVQPPDEMLARYLAARTGCQNFFSGDKVIDITINQFHVNLSDMTVNLGIMYQIQDSANQIQYVENHLYQRKVEVLAPENFASAFAALFEEFADALEKQTQKN